VETKLKEEIDNTLNLFNACEKTLKTLTVSSKIDKIRFGAVLVKRNALFNKLFTLNECYSLLFNKEYTFDEELKKQINQYKEIEQSIIFNNGVIEFNKETEDILTQVQDSIKPTNPNLN
jgi:hypothetical protein